MNPLERLDDLLRLRGRRHRRASTRQGPVHGLAHIEIRGGRRPGAARMLAHLREELHALRGVHWAEVDGVLGRVVVAFEDEKVDLEDLVDVVEAIEEAHGRESETFGFDREEHPLDGIAARRALVALCADLAGIGVSVAGTALRLSPLPVELASVVSFVDATPRLRRLLEDRIGPTTADLGLAVTNAVSQGLGAGPFGLAVDAMQRVSRLTEARASARTFVRHSSELSEPGALHRPVHREPRPVPLPAGPVERYADRAGLAAVVGTGATLATTLDVRRAAAVALAGMAKPARLGREAFATQLGRDLARRGILNLDASALRRMDRVDTVVVAAPLLVSDPSLLDGRPARGRRRLAPGARELVASIRRAGHMFAVLGGDAELQHELRADLLLEGGEGAADAVRALQADGCVVALVAAEPEEAIIAADVGIGVPDAEGDLPRSGDLLCLKGLVEAEFLVAATAVAHEASRQSAALALAGSALGAGLGLTSPPNRASARALNTVNAASVLAMANGTRAGLSLGRRPAVRVASTPWHELDVAEVMRRLESGLDGLDESAARRRLPPSPHAAGLPLRLGRSIVDELANPLTPVLVGGSALAAATGSTVDAALVAGVAAAGSLVGGVQRLRAELAVEALARRTAPTARVLRGGGVATVDAGLLVPGDVVLLESGDAVPADCRVVETDGLEVDESSLTGESFPVEKGPQPVVTASVAERTSMLYEGSTVAAGQARAVVVEVGSTTEANAGFAAGAAQPPSGGVERRLRELTALTIPVAAAGGAAVAASALLRGNPLAGAAGPAVSLAVAAIPEGLPVLATAAQIAAARRLAGHGIVVGNPRAVEALGRVEVLCVDKTGTLTEGRIELHSVLAAGGPRPVAEAGDAECSVVAAALRATPAAEDDRSMPHMTDEAVVRGADRLGITAELGAEDWKRVDELHFEPRRGYHATLGRAGGSEILTVKGAPEELAERCLWRVAAAGSRGGGSRRRFDGDAREQLAAEVDALARQGLRVLAVAERRTDATAGGSPRPGGGTVEEVGLVEERALADEDVTGLTLLGLVALADAIRPTAAQAVDGVRAAGVEVVMVTGDHPSTAEGIAAELGILDGRRVMTGTELDGLGDDELDAVIGEVSVFARVTPLDKVRIVSAYQRAGRAVAMTGDGANDAAAIRLADVGIALGARATPAARDAADVVIADDRIETIVDAVIEGRALWAAVRDAIAILLGGNLGEILFTAGASAAVGRSPLNARQLLLVNLLTDVAPALTIAVRQPRDRDAADLAAEGPELSLGAPLRRAIALRAATTAAGAGGAFAAASVTGRPHRAGTTALVALVATQLGQTVVSSWSDPWTLAAAAASAGAMCAIVQTPGVSQLFGCTPLGPVAWCMALGSAGAATAASVVGPALVRQLRRERSAPA